MIKLKSRLKKLLPIIFLEDYYSYKSRKAEEKKYKSLMIQTQLHYKDVEKKIKNKGRPIRFASYVIFDSTFCAYNIMNYMLQNKDEYSPKIVIIPDVSRGKLHMVEQYEKTKSFFLNKYGTEYVLDGYDIINNTFFDYSDDFDIVYLANPYDSMVNKVHSIKYISKKNILPIYLSYGCHVDRYSCHTIIPLLEISLFWKVFADNVISFKDYKKYELLHGKNVVLSGYAKMDELSNYKKIDNKQKTIIIAPHHTINMQSLPLSNFLDNYDFILELPKMYPDIKFIFRPHPLLFVNMVNEGHWTIEQVNQYIRKLESLGVYYSFGGDYLDTFVQSDAIIHDCSSFVVEYLYTGKPCCFFAKENYKLVFSKLGKSCLKYYYLAFNRKQICDFIDNIVLKNNDPLFKKRTKFVKEKISINYPNSSSKILSEINKITL